MSAGSKPGAFSKDAIGVGFLGDARALLAVGADLTTKAWVLPSFAELAPARAKRLVGGGGGGATGCASAGSNGSGGGGGANGAGAVEQSQGSAPQVESRKATLSPDGRLLAAMLGREGQVRVWAVDSLQATTATSDSAAPATGQPAGAVGTGGTAGGGALALAAPTVTFLFDQRLHHVPSYAVCFTHDSTGLVSGSEDGSICVWALKPDRSGLVSTDVEWKAHGGARALRRAAAHSAATPAIAMPCVWPPPLCVRAHAAVLRARPPCRSLAACGPWLRLPRCSPAAAHVATRQATTSPTWHATRTATCSRRCPSWPR